MPNIQYEAQNIVPSLWLSKKEFDADKASDEEIVTNVCEFGDGERRASLDDETKEKVLECLRQTEKYEFVWPYETVKNGKKQKSITDLGRIVEKMIMRQVEAERNAASKLITMLPTTGQVIPADAASGESAKNNIPTFDEVLTREWARSASLPSDGSQSSPRQGP